MAEGMVGGALVTLLIEAVINYAKSALICKRECRKLQEELELIRPDVKEIEQQMHRRRETPRAEPLEVVERWLARLKEKLTEAETEVHRCSSGTKLVSHFHLKENHDLAKKIQSLLIDIRRLAGDDVSRANLSSTISNGSSHHSDGSSHHCNGSADHASSPGFETQGSMHRLNGSADVSSPGFETQGSMLHRQRMEEIGSILHAEDQTRHSMNLRRHSIASFDLSRPVEQPVNPLHHSVSSFDFLRPTEQPAVTPLHHFDHQQQFVYTPQAAHFYVPPVPQNFAHQGWFPSPSNGPYGHYGSS